MVTGYALPRRVVIHTPTVEQRAEETARRPTHTDFIDLGLPVPESYDSDMIGLLVQSPYRLYAYWDLASQSWKSLEAVFKPSEVKKFRTVIKLSNPAWGWEILYDTRLARSWWFEVYPDEPYQLEVGFYSQTYGYVRWLRSRQVRTPRVGPGLDVPLADGRREVIATPAMIEPQQAVEATPSWLAQLPEWLQQVLQKVWRGGALTEEELKLLPEWLRYQLHALWTGVSAEAMRRAFLEYLPELVYEVSPETYETVSEFQREEFRLVETGSEVNVQPPFVHRWPPGLGHPGSWPFGVPGSLWGARPL